MLYNNTIKAFLSKEDLLNVVLGETCCLDAITYLLDRGYLGDKIKNTIKIENDYYFLNILKMGLYVYLINKHLKIHSIHIKDLLKYVALGLACNGIQLLIKRLLIKSLIKELIKDDETKKIVQGVSNILVDGAFMVLPNCSGFKKIFPVTDISLFKKVFSFTNAFSYPVLGTCSVTDQNGNDDSKLLPKNNLLARAKSFPGKIENGALFIPYLGCEIYTALTT